MIVLTSRLGVGTPLVGTPLVRIAVGGIFGSGSRLSGYC
jgi:hypothetical protein